MKATVYSIPGSHPVQAVMLMLERKGIAAKRHDLPNAMSRGLVRMLGFPAGTVPAVKIDGRKLQTTRGLARALDELVPEPALFPADPTRRAAVEAAERWGDEVLQSVPRRLAYWALRRDPAGRRSFVERPVLGMPPALVTAISGPFLRGSVRINKATDDAVRADLAALPALLDQVDDLIANGVIGTDEPNAADFQILTSVRLLMGFEDFAPLLEGRPAASAATRLAPSHSGWIPAIFPREWLPSGQPVAGG